MFCKYCGNELPENAVVCLKCGCLVNGAVGKTLENEPIAPQTVENQATIGAQPTMEVYTKKSRRKFPRLARIFSIVATTLSCVTVICALWFFVLMYAALSGGNTDGVNYGGMAIAIFALFGLIGMFAVSPFALTTGILAFVFQRKSAEGKGAFPVVAFVLGIVTFALSWGTYLSLILSGA